MPDLKISLSLQSSGPGRDRDLVWGRGRFGVDHRSGLGRLYQRDHHQRSVRDLQPFAHRVSRANGRCYSHLLWRANRSCLQHNAKLAEPDQRAEQ
jgi:hypothetical protein